MRLCFVVQRFGPEIAGGAESACRQFAIRMAKRAGSETIEVPASHAVYVSKPEEVARLIERAAKASAK